MSENTPNNDLFCAIGHDSGNNDENHGIDMAIAKYLDGLSYHYLDRKFSGINHRNLTRGRLDSRIVNNDFNIDTSIPRTQRFVGEF